MEYGIAGDQAPELNVNYWINGKGEQTEAIKLADHKDQFKVIYCFQSWCPGCHSIGIPSLQRMVAALKDHDKVSFLAVQTVFEGKETNTREKIVETQQKYELPIPFGHDEGDASTDNRSSIMYHYRTGGTPWFIFIDQNDRVVFNDDQLDTEKAIEYLKTIQ